MLMHRSIGFIAGLIVALVVSGCLRKETRHTLYLSEDGEVRWLVEESGVASDHDDEGRRLEEEQAYIFPALTGSHPAARGLQALEPVVPIRTTVLRDERPFHVVTEARLARIDQTIERLFRACGVKASAALAAEGPVTRLHLRLDFTRPVEERETPALVLLEEFADYRFVLTTGRFVAGGGFDVLDRSAAALSRDAMARLDAAIAAQEVVEFVLTWRLEQ
jgi:hypothetical protein